MLIIVRPIIQIGSPVSFGTHINMSNYLAVHVPASEALFVLDGVLVHQGTAEWGHYIAFVRNETDHAESGSRDTWYKCDDDRVSEVTFDDVLAESIGNNNKYDGVWGNSGTAYMLFYSKVKTCTTKISY